MLRGIALLFCAAAVAAPLAANAGQSSVTVRHVNLAPLSDAEARRTFAKLDDAALRACGGSGFSLREAKAALRDSPCWQDAMNDALRHIDSPALNQRLDRYHVAP